MQIEDLDNLLEFRSKQELSGLLIHFLKGRRTVEELLEREIKSCKTICCDSNLDECDCGRSL